MTYTSDEFSRITIPRLDFSYFSSEEADSQQSFSKDFVNSLSRFGFVTMINHPFTDDEIEQLFLWNRRFFALPDEEKMKAAHPKQANPHRGYSYVGQERLTSALEIKETFDQGPSQDDIYPNRWPPESSIAGFRSSMEAFFDRCHAVHILLLGALERGLDLPPGFLSHRCLNNSSELRLNHYPSLPASEISQSGAKRIAEHSDFGTLTFLFQDDVGGLEVESQDSPGVFFPVAAGEGKRTKENLHVPKVLTVNAGDCLQRWTNDKLKSAVHRVVLPQGVRDDDIVRERYSAAYFAKPDREQHVGSLTPFLEKGEEGSGYERITAWEFNQSRLGGTY